MGEGEMGATYTEVGNVLRHGNNGSESGSIYSIWKVVVEWRKLSCLSGGVYFSEDGAGSL